ncbi:MAG: ammonium transporter [Caldilineaceae bacterium]|nr:ammonium transporter [Caldilineaceae bacterium]
METAQIIELIDTSWILVAAALLFLMQAGFLARELGLTRRKNNMHIAAKNMVNFAVAVVLYWLVGFGIMYGVTSRGIMGSTFFAPDLLNAQMAVEQGATTSLPAFFLFQALVCGTVVTIISGAGAEKMRFAGHWLVSMVVAAIIYPFAGHWIWGGFFSGRPAGWIGAFGFVDFAGATVVHSVGGWAALALLIVLGPRAGRFKKDGTPNRLAKANLPMAALGTFMLWLGWFGFIGGHALLSSGGVSVVIVNTLLAGAAGLLAVIPIRLFANSGAVEADYLLKGVIAGLVAIAASAHAVHPQAAITIGWIGAWVMLVGEWALLRLGVDDAVGIVPVHLGAGIWGTLAVAFFGDPRILGTGLNFVLQFGAQLIGILAAGGWTFLTTIIFVGLMDLVMPLRVTLAEEQLGLNIVEQDAEPDYSGYPGLEDLLATYRQEIILQKISRDPLAASSTPPAPASPFAPIPET